MSRFSDIDPQDIDPDTGRPYAGYSSPSLEDFHKDDVDFDEEAEADADAHFDEEPQCYGDDYPEFDD